MASAAGYLATTDNKQGAS